MQYKKITDIRVKGAEKAKSDKLRTCGECCKLIRPKEDVTIVCYTYVPSFYIEGEEEDRAMSFEFLCPECGRKHIDIP